MGVCDQSPQGVCGCDDHGTRKALADSDESGRIFVGSVSCTILGSVGGLQISGFLIPVLHRWRIFPMRLLR
ncbi:ORF65 [Duck adenovirus 3]|uniref:ORF65 n=3 Tax=Duck aviadenovirus B TaxID=1534553 RepID=A0A5F2P0G9_9ADEN|nr:ORF65 [Duck adenovirus 2]AYH52280.1 ORF65 [Duck adenovirus 3]QKW90005.1 ORF65 [Duck aviadenovirus B]AYH52312.1 ORF65 [Duck adenovirus 3]AYH52340.1 ORF65 [Duck adenovirus 3]